MSITLANNGGKKQIQDIENQYQVLPRIQSKKNLHELFMGMPYDIIHAPCYSEIIPLVLSLREGMLITASFANAQTGNNLEGF